MRQADFRGAALLLLLAGLSAAACAGKSSSPESAAAGSGGGSGSSGNGGGATGGSSGKASTSGTGGQAGTGTTAQTCDDVRAEAAAELESIQRCMTAAECGQVLSGTSCGCTRDLVARNDADVARFQELMKVSIAGEQCVVLGSDCDCPEADGFACQENRCTWNYVNSAYCSSAAVSTLCVSGIPIDSGELLREDTLLGLVLRPLGCYSSSCTQVISACNVVADGDDFVVKADLCLKTRDDTACTKDCGGGSAPCLTDLTVSAGTHTVRLEGDFNLSVTFTVPSVVTDGSLCDAMDQ